MQGLIRQFSRPAAGLLSHDHHQHHHQKAGAEALLSGALGAGSLTSLAGRGGTGGGAGAGHGDNHHGGGTGGGGTAHVRQYNRGRVEREWPVSREEAESIMAMLGSKKWVGCFSLIPYPCMRVGCGQEWGGGG